MHLQIRTSPARSRADLPALLAVLASKGINIVAAGGSDIEKGGEFVFAVEHGQEEAAVLALEAERFHPRVVEVETRWMTNEPGQLHACVTSVAGRNAPGGRVIRDIAIGVPGKDGLTPVQIYSEVRFSAPER